MKTITVKELISQLQKRDENKPVNISMVGITANDSWDAPLPFGDITVSGLAKAGYAVIKVCPLLPNPCYMKCRLIYEKAQLKH